MTSQTVFKNTTSDLIFNVQIELSKMCKFYSSQSKADSLCVREGARFGGHCKHSQQACNPVHMTWFCLHATMK